MSGANAARNCSKYLIYTLDVLCLNLGAFALQAHEICSGDHVNGVAERSFHRNSTQQLGLFTLQEFDLGALRAEIGGRYEHSDVASQVIGAIER
jgi:hypothetical protein